MNDAGEIAPASMIAATAKAFEPIALSPLPQTPLVSVVMTSYNYARFIAKAIRSLQQQSYVHWEAVICDDGSTDNSPGIIAGLAAAEPRLRPIYQPNGGQCVAVNRAAGVAAGDIICFLDADDEFDADKIRQVVAAFRTHPNAGVCSHYLRAVDADGDVIVAKTPARLDSGWLADRAFTRGCSVMVPVTSGMSMRAEVCRNLFPMPPSLKRDADGYLFMAAQFLTEFCAAEATLGNYRVHGNNMGGLIDFNPARLNHELSLINARSASLTEFLESRFGEGCQKVDVGTNPHYIQTVLKLRALDADPAADRAATTAELIGRHPNPSWRRVWSAIFLMPRWMRAKILPLASRSYAIKGLLIGMMTPGANGRPSGNALSTP